MTKFTIGSDTEVFLRDKTNGMYIPGIGLIGGSKHFPKPLPHLGNGFALQEDNVAVEFNIPPASDRGQFIANMMIMKDELEKQMGNIGLNIEYIASARFEPKTLTSPEAQEMGCDVDYNAWTGKANPRPDGGKTNLRTTGGHVHVGTDLNPIALIRAMDLFLGVRSSTMDKDTERRVLYGKAGAYRPKPYGAEYRVLSSFFMQSAELLKWVYDNTARAVEFVASKTIISDDEGKAIIRAINKVSTKDIDMLTERYGLV